MHIHILGICGTFMGGIAQIAREAGHRVTGCDKNVYPPMSDALRRNVIEIIEGYGSEQLELKPDLWVVGNAVSRGNPLLEAILNEGLPYTSGPQWLSENILTGKKARTVLAVAGTHGKTTTTSMLTWILMEAGLNPGFLIGGLPCWGERSAALGDASAPFVIEADEYDTAFCDKRSKFVHYRPRIAILNNLEYDHADIFENLRAIETQFHHLVRTIPSEGTIVANAASDALKRVIERGCWSKLEHFGVLPCERGWALSESQEVFFDGCKLGKLEIGMPGRYNALNALAAVAAARAAGVEPARALGALKTFPGVHRRQEVKGEADGCLVIDDFAHHPTAIKETIDGVKAKYPGRRILAVLEPRSNTMKLGTMKDRLAAALADADEIYCFVGAGVSWSPEEALAALLGRAFVTHDFEAFVSRIVADSRPGDVILCMSNGGFGGIHGKLLAKLSKKAAGA